MGSMGHLQSRPSIPRLWLERLSGMGGAVSALFPVPVVLAILVLSWGGASMPAQEPTLWTHLTGKNSFPDTRLRSADVPRAKAVGRNPCMR